jgi:carboxyl-terminal processing protease
MRTSLRGIFESLAKDDCSRLTDLQKTLIRHHEAAAKFVRTTVSDPAYAVDPSVELVLDPERRGYPETPEERNQLQESLIHFQISNYLAADTPLEEAKRRLIQRYERRLKQLLDVPPPEINADFLDSFAVSLDPHSNYLSADVLEDFRISMTLSLEGIGVALAERDVYAVAERIIPGGAADRQKGLKPKDKIIAVTQADGKSIDIIDMPLRDAVALIRGKKGTKVGLTVLRQSDKTERFSIEIVRDTIDLEEQAAKLRFEERDLDGKHLKLAVLELPSFYGDADPTKRQCTDDVTRLLAQVKQEKADGLLLDLSRNGGGLLQHAVEISGYFLREGEVVAIANGRGQKQMLRDPDRSTLYAGPLVVLISRVSASAAEILAGALKDYQRGVIVGDDHTFGKGTVQTVSTLPPGEGALKITTGLFFRPGGQSTQHSGVPADVVMPSFLAGVGDEFGEKTQPYSLPPESIAPFLSDSANAEKGPDRWRRVTPGTVAVLSNSKRRIEANAEFVELREKIAERRRTTASSASRDPEAAGAGEGRGRGDRRRRGRRERWRGGRHRRGRCGRRNPAGRGRREPGRGDPVAPGRGSPGDPGGPDRALAVRCSRSSLRVIRRPMPPSAVQSRAAAWAARSSAFSSASPKQSPAANAPWKASPAPVVSTTRTRRVR